MPIVNITLIQGRDPEAIKTCMREVARAVHRTLDAPLETIRVLVTQIPASQWGVGEYTREEIEAAARQERDV